MTEYIKREDAIQALMSLNIMENARNLPELIINGVPTINIVHCKDCKFNKGKYKCFNPNSVAIFPSENDFCSYGKPKEEGDAE